jgi:hypothetical protein
MRYSVRDLKAATDISRQAFTRLRQSAEVRKPVSDHFKRHGSRTARGGGVSRMAAQRPSGYARWRGAAYPARMPCRV